MFWVNSENRIPIKSWCKNVEPGAMEQAVNNANLPFTFRHIALMPDCHMGYGLPVGGVMATDGAVVPYCVGVDIGCGMTAVNTRYHGDVSQDVVKKIFGSLREIIPVGFSHQNKPQLWTGFDSPPNIPIIEQEIESAKNQLGTLGGGNHFIEIQRSGNGQVWLMIHSGSRNFGYKIAGEYHKKAKGLCEEWYSSIPNQDLSFLPLSSDEGKEYVVAMGYALDFAQANRSVMMERFMCVVESYIECDFGDEIDVHHNYARMEHHFGKNVMVHRKGATSARAGEVGIIPGSQGTASYIVEGLGNPLSFTSCSHGAGRAMGRKQAQRELNLEEQQAILDEQGIVHSVRNARDLDEAPGSYKNIEDVMESQSDLVKIIVKLRPLGVMKG